MASVQFTVDSSGIDKASQRLARAIGQFEWITARAMTTAAKAAKEAIARDVFPRIQGGPTSWTRRGLIASYAKPSNLTSQVGFNYGDGAFRDSGFTPKRGGVPAGRYMENLARGGDRRPKSSELQARRSGLIKPGQFLVPNAAKGTGLRLSAQGNLSGPQYTSILSRVRGLSTPGSTQNAPQGPGSRGRTAAKRRQADYFVMRYEGGSPSRWQLGAEPAFIAKRVGRGGRGFVPVLWITDQPNYERRFPIKSIALREYQRVYGEAWRAGLKAELERRGMA